MSLCIKGNKKMNELAKKIVLLVKKQIELQDQVKAVTRAMGETLNNCPISREDYYSETPQSHLRNWLVDSRVSNKSLDLKLDAMQAECIYCRKAYDQIQERKALRRRIGAVKSVITRLARRYTLEEV